MLATDRKGGSNDRFFWWEKLFQSLPSPHKQPPSPTANFSFQCSHHPHRSHRSHIYRRRLALGISAPGGRSIRRDHDAPIDNAVAAKYESCPGMIRPPPTTTTTAATVIAFLASECCVQLSREGSGYGRRSGHHVSPTIAPPDNQQSLPPPPPLPPSLPLLHTRGIQQTPGGETRIRSGDTKRYGLGSWGRKGPLPAKEVDVRGSQAATVRWLRWVRKET